MSKIIYEYFYVVGENDFHTCYELIVDKETPKMYHGTAYGGNFLLKKENLHSVHVIKDRKYGLVYRVQIEEQDEGKARGLAKEIIYNYMLDVAIKFYNWKEN